MKIQRENYDELGEVLGPYSHSVTHQSTLYTSGLTAYGTPAQTKGISDQAKEVFSQINLICLTHNVTLKNLIKVTVYVSELAEIAALRKTLFETYGDHIPASSLIKVDALFSEDLKVEVEATIAL